MDVYSSPPCNPLEWAPHNMLDHRVTMPTEHIHEFLQVGPQTPAFRKIS